MPRNLAVYAAAILTSRGAAALRLWWERDISPLESKVFSHHMTIKFRPSDEELYELMERLGGVGETVQLRVIGYVEDIELGVQAVVVEGVYSTNDIPHITVATDGAKPFLSNKALSRGWERVVGGPVIEARLGYFDGRTDRYDLP